MFLPKSPGFWCQAPGWPRKKLNEYNQQLPIIFNLSIRQPLQADDYRSHSFFYWYLTTPRRIQPFVFIASVETDTPP